MNIEATTPVSANMPLIVEYAEALELANATGISVRGQVSPTFYRTRPSLINFPDTKSPLTFSFNSRKHY